MKLGSTYWTFGSSSNPSVLRQDDQARYAPGSCPQGAGCALETVTFQAMGSGTAEVTASWTSCGEALSCGGSAGSYRLTVTVIPA